MQFDSLMPKKGCRALVNTPLVPHAAPEVSKTDIKSWRNRMDGLNPACLWPRFEYICVGRNIHVSVKSSWDAQAWLCTCTHTQQISLMCLIWPLWHRCHRFLSPRRAAAYHHHLKGLRQHGSPWKLYPLAVTSPHESAPHQLRGVTWNPSIAPLSTHAVHAVCMYAIPQVSRRRLSFFCNVGTQMT